MAASPAGGPSKLQPDVYPAWWGDGSNCAAAACRDPFAPPPEQQSVSDAEGANAEPSPSENSAEAMNSLMPGGTAADPSRSPTRSAEAPECAKPRAPMAQPTRKGAAKAGKRMPVKRTGVYQVDIVLADVFSSRQVILRLKLLPHCAAKL